MSEVFQRAVDRGAFNGLTAAGERRVVVLPWPSPKLSPNARVHWGVKAGAVARARDTARWIVLSEFRRKPGWDGARLDVEFCPPDRRRRDLDNTIASSKGIFDGIADALGIDDSKFIPTYRIGAPIKGGAVRVTIGPA